MLAVVAIAAIAGWGVLRLVEPSTAVVLQQPAATSTAQPAVESRTEIVIGPPRTLLPPPGTSAWCGEQWLVAVAVDVAGALQAWCADGAIVPIAAPGVHRAPTLGSDALLAELRGDETGQPQLQAVDLATGGVTALGAGSVPALTAESRLAWVEAASPDASLRLATAEDIGSPPEDTIELPAVDRVTSLSWDRNGRWVFLSASTPSAESGTVVAVDTTATAAQPVPLDPGGTVRAAAGETDTTDTGVLLVQAADPDVLQIVGAQMQVPGADTPQYAAIDRLDPDAASGFDPAGEAFITPLGLATPDDVTGGWVPGLSISWLVGDGRQVWHLANGVTQLITADVSAVAVNPAFTAAVNAP